LSVWDFYSNPKQSLTFNFYFQFLFVDGYNLVCYQKLFFVFLHIFNI